MAKSILLEDLIDDLVQVKKELGNVEVFTASDAEGNSFGIIDNSYAYGQGNGADGRTILVIQPIQNVLDDEL